METVIGDCPLGATCEKVEERDGKNVIVRCPWFVKVEGKHPQSGKSIDNWDCAIAWMPILSVNVADQMRRTTKGVEQMRNKL